MEIKIFKNRLFDIPRYQLENYPRQDAICDKKGGDGTWRKFSTTEIVETADKISLGLLKKGYGPGDKIAIISYNRTEWVFSDHGILQIGAVNVPMYPNMSEDNYRYIFNDAEVKAVFVENEEVYRKVERVLPQSPTVKEVFSFDKIDGVKHWSEVIDSADESLRPRLEEIEEKVHQDDLATIIYTSGTTGEPKGVMLTHYNIISDVVMVLNVEPHGKEDIMFSFLPMCHIFERTAVYFYIMVGGAIYFAESIDKIGENLLEVKPNYFTTVPRVIEKIYDKIMQKGRELTGLKKSIFGWAVRLGNKYHPQGKNSAFYNFKLAIANKLVFSKWREALGGNVKGIISGAAAMQPRLERIFNAAGIPIRAGYGLTETSPVLTCNRFTEGDWHIGTVGLPLEFVQIKIDENTGEILAKGPNVTRGYYNRPEDTKKAIDEEGWFHTGDIGEWVDGRFLKITDRLKEVFKTSGGKFVAPLPIENKMKESYFIENIMVIGENRRFVSALIVPNFEFIEKWCKKKCINLRSREEMIASDILKERIWQDIEKYNKRFGKVQQIKRFALVSEEWSLETGELTPTLKLKRRVILQKYKDLIEEIYADSDLEKHYK
jgi:long-chain acyl-CoA synthetase